MKPYDCVIVGTGGVVSAALYHLARRGARVLGLDRFPPGHDRGSSHGDTRIIRMAYFEHPSYVPMVRRAYELWAELAERCSQQLYHEIGLLQIGPADGVVVPGVLASAREHRLEVEELTASEVERRFSGFHVPESMTAVFERRAGYLRVEACVLAHINEAVKLGAEVRSGETVRAWRAEGSSVVVATERDSYAADRLIITPGAWAADLLGDLGLRFAVRRKAVFWYKPTDPAYSAANGCPIFLYETPAGIFYGYPQIDQFGLKAAEHTGGQPVADPLAINRELDPQDQARVEGFLREYLPGVTHQCQKHVVCMYTMSPDEHFVVDCHPRYPQVAFAAGLSGHGFKFAGVLGEALTELALDGQTSAPIGFLACDRPGMREG
jgi:monomeric sarcosine oxidase